MPFDCRHRRDQGQEACLGACPARAGDSPYRYVRVEGPDQYPEADPGAIDVAVLDMNHGWPNLGHDAIVHAVQNIACDLIPELTRLGVRLRAVSYDVRRGGVLPAPPGGSCAIYVGTGGPGHLDPARNDGVSEGSQGIREDPSWEAPTFALFDAILADEEAALLGVCHTFGVMCRWLGVAEPVLRSRDKGGKSAGIMENVLTEEARQHPWFSRFSGTLPDRHRLRVLDNRFFDLMPIDGQLPASVLAIGHETLGIGGQRGPALTMMEVARDVEARMPRVFGVNHHPEVVNRPRQLTILRERLRRGDVSAEWYEERARALTETFADEDIDYRLQLTSSYTFFAPLRYYIVRQLRLRARASGRDTTLHEAATPIAVDETSAADRPALQEGSS